ncbi:MAG: ABC transporter permease subunit [Alicyclobacillus sp.]|nr:ABC transporter permease subunit [Alicyclobacillus sp.]
MRRFWGLGLYLPIFAFLVVFAFIPAFGLLVDSLHGEHGFTLEYYRETLQGQYFHAFRTTAWLSLVSSLVGLVWGALVTFALTRVTSAWLQRWMTALSSVMANFAGLPLAIAFMATLGASGIITVWINHLFGTNLAQDGWNLASVHGLMVVYATFQTPLAVILLLPAFTSLNPQWEEAVYSLGAGLGTYIRKVVIPIVFPGLLGTFALLFANSFSAYVTAVAIAGGSVNLVPIQIGFFIDGNVMLDIGLGDALAMEEMVVLGAAIALFFAMQRLQARRIGQRRRRTGVVA